jgi:hypothetical protein
MGERHCSRPIECDRSLRHPEGKGGVVLLLGCSSSLVHSRGTKPQKSHMGINSNSHTSKSPKENTTSGMSNHRECMHLLSVLFIIPSTCGIAPYVQQGNRTCTLPKNSSISSLATGRHKSKRYVPCSISLVMWCTHIHTDIDTNTGVCAKCKGIERSCSTLSHTQI